MARYNQVSVVIDDTNIQAIIDGINTAEQTLPFLATLAKQNPNAHRMGDASVAYVNDCLDAAQHYATEIPSSIDVAELHRDKKLFDQLSLVESRLLGFLEAIQNAKGAAASDLMKPCDDIYDVLKRAAKSNPSLDPIVKNLSKRYKGQGKKAKV